MIKQYTLVARAAADRSKKYGRSICSAGITPDDGLIRVYPILTKYRMKAWDTYEVSVDRCRSDTRNETWKADTSFAPKRIGGQDRYQCIAIMAKHNLSASIRQLNEDRKSLAVVIPEQINEMWFDRRDEANEDWGKESVYEVPRIAYELGGKLHRHQILEIGCYEWLRNRRNDRANLWDNLRLTDPEYRHMFLIGNMARHRNSWMIIAVLSIKLSKWKYDAVLPIEQLERQIGINTCLRRNFV